MRHKAGTCWFANPGEGVEWGAHPQHNAPGELLCLDGDEALLRADAVAEQGGAVGFEVPVEGLGTVPDTNSRPRPLAEGRVCEDEGPPGGSGNVTLKPDHLGQLVDHERA